MNIKKSIGTLALLFAPCLTISATEGYTYFNYGSENTARQALWGTGKQESYDVAMKIVDPDMVGKTISEISIPVVECDGISDYSIWLTSELKIESTEAGKVNVPDIASFKCSPDNGRITITLDAPLEIRADGVYVGYSFVMSKLDVQEAAPIVVTQFTDFPESFYLHTSRSYKAWKNMGERNAVSPVINVKVLGDFPENSLEAVKATETNMEIGKDGATTLTLHNTDGNPIDSFAYSIKMTDGTMLCTQSVALESPLQPSVYDTSFVEVPVSWNVITNPNPGNYLLEIEVAEVNEVQNSSSEKTALFDLNLLSFVPVHRPVLEEYTGTWCGYCPRGYVGLEIMNDLYPDEFIGVSYHGGDEMEVIPQEDYANKIAGYPDSWIDRTEQTDAYSGRYDESTFGIDKVWELYREKLAPADINIEATFNDETRSAVEIKATTTFAKKASDATYRQVFMLLGNGMTKESWYQTNYYAGDKTYDNSPYRDYWAPFVDGGGNVRGVVYNDILLAATNIKGEGHDLPEDLEVNIPVKTEHSFVIDEVVNVRGHQIVQDRDQLYAVVLLINANTGKVENANKTKVADSTGVHDPTMNATQVETIYYDLAGRKIAYPSNGVVISHTLYSDGSVKTEKLIYLTH